MLSGPVSSAAVNTGVAGLAGISSSTVTVSAALTAPALPAASVWNTRKLCTPASNDTSAAKAVVLIS